MQRDNMGCALILGLPPGALGGIDLFSFTTSTKFRGIKHIPSGYHFIYAGTNSTFSERHGLWLNVPNLADSGPNPLIVTKWDAENEELVLEADETERIRWRANLGSIWRDGLAPYRQSAAGPAGAELHHDLGDWPLLTSEITAALLSRVLSSRPELWGLGTASSDRQDVEQVPGLSHENTPAQSSGCEISLLPIDLKRTWPEGATGRERTECARDRSWALDNIAGKYCTNGNLGEITGELQFCFLMALTIDNFSCLEQWKRLLAVIFTSVAAVLARPDFFVNTLTALHTQLEHVKDAEAGLIDLEGDSGILLRNLLLRFREGLETLNGHVVMGVAEKLDEVEDYLRQEHGWVFHGDTSGFGVVDVGYGEQIDIRAVAQYEGDDDEFAPQIVELTSEQEKMLSMDSGPHLRLRRSPLREDPQAEVQSDGEDADIADESGRIAGH